MICRAMVNPAIASAAEKGNWQRSVVYLGAGFVQPGYPRLYKNAELEMLGMPLHWI